jgi:predicted RNA-binding Zn-ribbon protein involved in translation (DUF1610 family)
MIEFDCPDCGAHVFALGLTEPVPPGQRCATCQWLADPAERAKLRVFLAQREDAA